MPETKTVHAPADLEQYRADLKRIVRDVVQEAVTEQRTTAEEASKALRERLDAVDARVNAISDARRAQDVPGALGGRDESYSIARVVRAALEGENSYERVAPYEYRVSEDAREKQRAMGSTPDDKGGFIIPPRSTKR